MRSNESFRLNDFGYLVNFNFYNEHTENQLEILNGCENQKYKKPSGSVEKGQTNINYSQTKKRRGRNIKVVVLFRFDG